MKSTTPGGGKEDAGDGNAGATAGTGGAGKGDAGTLNAQSVPTTYPEMLTSFVW